nr:immunoglobulin light chain junction region [Macaca mulatta]
CMQALDFPPWTF